MLRLPLLDQYLREQHDLTAVERFSRAHDTALDGDRYRELMPATPPGDGQQYAFEVDLDACSGCKACVTACHNLNGLDEGETWRAVGLLHGGTAAAPVKQVVTSACHHCLDPACMNGCPVRAYEKDPVTGIVKHLDDQCIGCQYCTFTCPYEVPQYNAKRGIVRKCDMCSDRLAADEAPACVQSCPNEAIAIRVIDQRQALDDAQGDAFLPGTPSPAITVPTTIYRTAQPPPRNLLPADFYSVAPSHHHVPLVVMLVLTQLSVGAFVIDAVVTRFIAPHVLQPIHALAALVVGLAALAASVFHLGRPLYAFRAVLGLGTSWMSREIVAFGAFAMLAMSYAALSLTGAAPVALQTALGGAVAAIGVIGILCSALIYHVTRKAWWTVSITGFKFFMTAALLGLASTIVTLSSSHTGGDLAPRLSRLVVLVSIVKLLGELVVLVHLRDKRYTELKRSAVLLVRDLRRWSIPRVAALIAGGILLPLAGEPTLVPAIASFVLLVIGELLERTLFFAAASAPGMPKGVR
ncbi:MAG TPA: DmsC/YnfH family molybdoenzyme membrane anchor subunit [Kofleriaceae bacterium]|nr:DmsC/YnfH family molybdoenzyme membrane anchor subunit [Kofleriaceae bacterium]